MTRIARRLSALLFGLCLSSSWLTTGALAQDAAGDWHGVLTLAPGNDLPLALHLKPGASGLEGTLDNPSQGVVGEPLSDVGDKDGKLTFTGTVAHGTFNGTWDPAARGWRGALSLRGHD